MSASVSTAALASVGHRLAVDLAGLVAADEAFGAGDHGQPDPHPAVDAGPQDQVDQAVGHPLLGAPRIVGGPAVLGVGLQRPPAGLRHRQRQRRRQAAHSVRNRTGPAATRAQVGATADHRTETSPCRQRRAEPTSGQP